MSACMVNLCCHLSLSELGESFSSCCVALQVHQRDVLDQLAARFMKDRKAQQSASVGDFDWVKQMRCYWVPEEDNCFVKVSLRVMGNRLFFLPS